MRTFDWEHAATTNSPEKLAWLKENHDKLVTEEQYIAAMKAIRATRNQPSKLRGQYKQLKNKFGFFKLDLSEELAGEDLGANDKMPKS